MPSLLHEGILELIRDRPEFAAELAQTVFRSSLTPCMPRVSQSWRCFRPLLMRVRIQPLRFQ